MTLTLVDLPEKKINYKQSAARVAAGPLFSRFHVHDILLPRNHKAQLIVLLVMYLKTLHYRSRTNSLFEL